MNEREHWREGEPGLGGRLREWDPAARLGEPGAEETAELGRALRREALRREREGARPQGWGAAPRRWALAAGVIAALGLILVLARGGRAPAPSAPAVVAESAAPTAGIEEPGEVAEEQTAAAIPSGETAMPDRGSEPPLPEGEAIRVARAPTAVAEESAGGPRAGEPRAAAPTGAGDRVDLEMTAANGVRIYWAIQISPGA